MGLFYTAIAETGVPPTRAELTKALSIRSRSGIEGHLCAFAKKGAITLTEEAARGIRILGGEGLPVIGRVAAGSPILAEDVIERHLELNPRLFTPAADYFL